MYVSLHEVIICTIPSEDLRGHFRCLVLGVWCNSCSELIYLFLHFLLSKNGFLKPRRKHMPGKVIEILFTPGKWHLSQVVRSQVVSGLQFAPDSNTHLKRFSFDKNWSNFLGQNFYVGKHTKDLLCFMDCICICKK